MREPADPASMPVSVRTAPGDGESPEEVCREVLDILALVGDKWTILVIGQIRDRTMRFGELHREVTGISQRMLTRTLRRLERDGLVVRTVYPSVPPRVDYVLTDLGTTLLGAVTALGDWAVTHRPEVKERRRRYDLERA